MDVDILSVTQKTLFSKNIKIYLTHSIRRTYVKGKIELNKKNFFEKFQ